MTKDTAFLRKGEDELEKMESESALLFCSNTVCHYWYGCVYELEVQCIIQGDTTCMP